MKAIIINVMLALFALHLSAQQVTSSPISGPLTKIRVPITTKMVKGKPIELVNIGSLSNGYYAFTTNKTFVQLNISNGHLPDVYDSQGTKMTFKKSSGTSTSYSCDGFVCTCSPDIDPVDCDKMIDETGCTPVISVDGTEYCIKGLFSLSNAMDKIPALIKSGCAVCTKLDPRGVCLEWDFSACNKTTPPITAAECQDLKNQISAKEAAINSKYSDLLRSHGAPLTITIPADRIGRAHTRTVPNIRTVPASILAGDALYQNLKKQKAQLVQQQVAKGCQ